MIILNDLNFYLQVGGRNNPSLRFQSCLYVTNPFSIFQDQSLIREPKKLIIRQISYRLMEGMIPPEFAQHKTSISYDFQRYLTRMYSQEEIVPIPF